MLSKVTNIKVSINCNKVSLDSVLLQCENKQIKTKVYPNFILFESKFVYTIFKNKEINSYNHINITKIKNKLELRESLNQLKTYFGITFIKNTLKVDNITGTLNLQKEIVLKELINYTETYKFDGDIFISYNNEKFPGAFLKVKKENKKIGSILVFHSGKVVFVGCKTIYDLKCLESLILAITFTK